MDWRYNTIWFDQIPASEKASLGYGQPPQPYGDTERAQYLSVRKFEPGDDGFQSLPAGDALQYLSLTLSRVTSFHGIGKLSGLKRLELHHCSKLESDAGLEHLADSLEWLAIDQSTKFSPGSNLQKLRNLRVLRLNACGPIPSLSFLEAFPKLIEFRFVDTSVTDGDLGPLIAHPALRAVGLSNKRNFNLKDKQVEAALLAKGAPEKVAAYKGLYETYRLAALGT